jgi:hypothetical protein
MAHPAYLREKARELRRTKRLTIDELARRLALPRTTIYYWVRDLPIPGSGSGGGWPESARRKGNRAMRRKYQLLRDEAYEEGLRSFAELAQSPSFRDFVCMYVAEGYKRRRNTVSLCNSSASVMKLAVHWMRRLSAKAITYSVHYHADQDLDELKSFWSEQLGIEPDSIRAHRKSNSGRLSGRMWRCSHGVLAATTNDTLFRARLQAWMDQLSAEWLI